MTTPTSCDLNVAIQGAQEAARRTMKDQIVIRVNGDEFSWQEMAKEGPWPNVEATIVVKKTGSTVLTYTFTKIFDLQEIPK